MAPRITLEEAEQLVTQLPWQEQLKLLAKISERLSESGSLTAEEERQRRQYAEQIERFLKMCDEMAVKCVGEVDSAEDIRQIRDERADRL